MAEGSGKAGRREYVQAENIPKLTVNVVCLLLSSELEVGRDV
ncbi:hypothetical protein [Salinicoccus halodurans]|nr:hypothetical protein [Salinicoccus halodurans]